MAEATVRNEIFDQTNQAEAPGSFAIETPESPRSEADEFAEQSETPVADQILTEARESFRLKDKIKDATNLEELAKDIIDVPLIQIGPEHYTGKEIANYINDARNFLNDNLDAIILYTMTRQDDNRQKVFADLVRKIPAGGELTIQEKVKDLMKGIMDEQFQEKKKEFILKSVDSVQDLETLYFVLGQFRVIKEGPDIYDKQEVINSIKKARGILIEAALIGDLAEKNPKQAQEEVRKTLSGIGGIPPHDAGIFKKAVELIAQEVKEKMVERKVKDVSSAPAGIKGLGTRLRGLFSRH